MSLVGVAGGMTAGYFLYKGYNSLNTQLNKERYLMAKKKTAKKKKKKR